MDISYILNDFKQILLNKYKNFETYLKNNNKINYQYETYKKETTELRNIIHNNPNILNNIISKQGNSNKELEKVKNIINNTSISIKDDVNLVKHTDNILNSMITKINKIQDNNFDNTILLGGNMEIDNLRSKCREELINNIEEINNIVRSNNLQIKYIEKFVTDTLRYHSFSFSELDILQYIYYNKNYDEVTTPNLQKLYIIDYIINSPVFIKDFNEFKRYEIEKSNKVKYVKNVVDCAYTKNYKYVQKIYDESFNKYFENNTKYSLFKNNFKKFNKEYIQHILLIIDINNKEYEIKTKIINKKILENFINILNNYKDEKHEFTKIILKDFINKLLNIINNETINIYIHSRLLKNFNTRQIHYCFILLDYFMNNICPSY